MTSPEHWELPRVPRRRDLMRLAEACGWTLETGGYEPLRAVRPGWRSIPIPGHTPHSRIDPGLAATLYKQLREPVLQAQEVNQLRSTIESLQQQLAVACQDRETLRRQLQGWSAASWVSAEDFQQG